MAIRKVLYVTNMEKPDFGDIKRLMVLRKVGLEEVVFFPFDGVEHWEREVAGYDLKTKTLEREKPVAAKVVKAVKQEGIPLITVNIQARSGITERSSFSKALIRTSPVPVLFLKGGNDASKSSGKHLFNHVIFATDWSPVSKTALKYLITNFREIIETLEIVNVINKKLSVRDLRELKRRLVGTRKVFLDMGIDAESHIYAGKPSDELNLAAKDYDATCIIMGTTTKSPFKAFVSQSCSYNIAERARVHALLVPEVLGSHDLFEKFGNKQHLSRLK